MERRFLVHMALINFILDLCALLLWLNWLSIRFDPLARTQASTLVGTLRKAEPGGPKKWKFIAGLILLLLVRVAIYLVIGPVVGWTPKLGLGIIPLYFRSDIHIQMLVFSMLSFGLTLAVFYSWVLLLSVVNKSVPDSDPLQRLVRLHFGWLERLPDTMKLLLPFLVGTLLWLGLQPLLGRLSVVPQIKSTAQLIEQAAVIGAGTYLAWKYLIVGVLVLHVLNSYVYLGNHPVWGFMDATARNMLAQFRWPPLRLGKMDFRPLVAIALVFLVTEFVSNPPARPAWWKPWFYSHLPF
ncbi:MAG: hypothetical protein JWR26_2290 [Pedosphaera sp.]|nr:hypothetical protein [Pedosphaera sp.]